MSNPIRRTALAPISCLAASLVVAGIGLAPAVALADRPAARQQRPQHAPPRWEKKEVEHRRTENGYEHDTTWTGRNGKTASREVDVTRDPATRTRTKDVTWTGPEGKTSSVHDVATRTDNGYTRETTTTGPQGNTTTRTATGTRDPETGSWTRTVEVDRDRAGEAD